MEARCRMVQVIPYVVKSFDLEDIAAPLPSLVFTLTRHKTSFRSRGRYSVSTIRAKSAAASTAVGHAFPMHSPAAKDDVPSGSGRGELVLIHPKPGQ